MDTLTHYRQIIKDALTEYASIPYSHGNFNSQTIFDTESDHYLLMLIGWEGPREVKRVHGCLLHLDIIHGKIWIQRDGTEQGITPELLKAGVPKEHIVLGFQHPRARRYTDFAAE